MRVWAECVVPAGTRWQGVAMLGDPGDDRFDALLADISAEVAAQQADDDAEQVQALVVAEFAEIDLAARLRASGQVRIDISDVGVIDGVVERVNAQVCVVHSTTRDWIVPLASIETIRGVSGRATPSTGIDSRLGLASILRTWCAEGRFIRCWLPGRVLTGSLLKIARDHCDVVLHGPDDVAAADAPPITISLAKIVAMCSP